MIKGIIYKYTSPSGKCYIGQTVNESSRKSYHKRNAFNVNSSSYHKPFYRAIRKYGWDSFDYQVLNTVMEEDEEALQDKLDTLEIYYIGVYEAYTKGYNCTVGGHQLRGLNHPSCGKMLSQEHKAKLKKSRSKIISQYSTEGAYIATYDSAAQAEHATGADSSGIIAVCKGKQKTAGGYQWRYGVTTGNIDQVVYSKPKRARKFGKENPRSKTVYQYTLDGELVRIWESGYQAEREEGYSSVYISKVCNKKLPFYGKKNENKYLWSFTEINSIEQKD